MDMEIVIPVYRESIKKFLILQTVEKSIATCLMNVVSLLMPYLPSTVSCTSMTDRDDSQMQDIKDQLFQYGLSLWDSTCAPGGIGNCFFLIL